MSGAREQQWIVMRPRTEVAIAFGVFAVLAIIALESGRRRRGVVDTDRRASSFLAGPQGLRGMAEVIERTGGTVQRWRNSIQRLEPPTEGRRTFVVADPVVALRPDEVVILFAWSAAGGDLVVGGDRTAPVMRCLGFDTQVEVFDSSRVVAPSGRRAGWVHSVLRTIGDSARTISAGPFALAKETIACPDLTITGTDTLVGTEDGAPVAILLTRRERGVAAAGERHILLLADMALLSNAGLRHPELPEYLLGTILARSRTVVFDEYHQGFGPQGSLAVAALAWSRSSPWGWLIWQAAVVGFLAFVSGAVRFGPLRAGIRRERRSPREHVKALATALAAARGHDVAIASLVRGLRRRLQLRTGADRGAVTGEPWPMWASRLQRSARTPELREGAEALARFASPGQPNYAVQDAANAVEDVWDALHR